MSLAQVKKFERFGHTIHEVQQERARQRMSAPPLPTKLSEIMMNHHASQDKDAIERRLKEAAYKKVHPNEKKAPRSEMERIIALDPKTSAQVIGHHRVPQLPPPPRPPPPVDELARMRTVFPRTTGGECGFHHDFAESDKREAKDAARLVAGLTAAQLKADPKMANALSSLRAHVLDAARKSGNDGVPTGIKTTRR